MVGFVLAQVAADEAEILSIGVSNDARRQGIALRLVQAARTAAAASGANRIFLEVAVSNEAALELYKKSGFAEVGRRPRYYASVSGLAQDALILAASAP
jgi:ribosomal-protein-alanine N-acetyltransferase